MSRATDDMLDELHGEQAKQLLSEMRSYREHKDEEGKLDPLPIPPALFAQINKYLKDNGVDRAATPGDDIDLLADEVPDFDNVVTGDFKCQQ